MHPSQAQPQDDLDTGSEDDTRDHDGSSLFDNGPNVGQENAQETLHSNGQLADTYDTAAEAIEGVIEDEQPEHEDFVEGYGSEEDEDDNDQETSMLVDGNEESLQESIQRGSTSATSGIDDVQDQEKDMMQGLQGAESSSERHDEQDAGINTATATATTTATTIATVSAQRESGNLESPDQDATTITVRESQAEGRPVKRNSGTFDFEIDDDTPNPSTSTPYSVVKQSWTEENDWDELKPLKGLGPIKVGDFALIALGEKKYRLKPPMAKIIDIRRGSTDACRTWVVIQWPYLVSEAVEVLKQARHPNAQRLVDGWPSRMRLLSDVYQILPAKSILKKVAPGKIHGEKMFKLGLEEGLNGRDNPGAAVVDAPKKSRKKT